MNHDELVWYEGMSVYFFYKERVSEIPSRLGRGIVHQGMCYRILSHGQSSFRYLELQKIPEEYIAEMNTFHQGQKSSLEEALEVAAKNGSITQIRPLLEVQLRELPKEDEEDSGQPAVREQYLPFTQGRSAKSPQRPS